ncbi:flippase [Leptospira levettii]|uniref:flippase n=1 Tax=Leptospira levettii TaxID=2023178 RepID=UPI00223DC080|nr:flippase [Leptospira levettii]MCW7497049.1 flippase [Leptospira levettii]
MKSIFFNSIWFFFDKVFKLIVGFAISVMIVRYLGPKWFGKYNYVNSIIVLFGIFVSFGSEGILVKFLVSEPDQKNEILSASFWFQTFFGILSFLLSVLFLIFLRNDSDLFQLLLILGIPLLFRSFSVVKYVYESNLEIKKVVIIDNLIFFTFSFIRVILIYFNSSFNWIFVSFATEGIISNISLYLYYRLNHTSFLKVRPKLDRIKSILKGSFPILVSGFAIIVYMKVDQIMIGSMLGDKQLGVYSVGVRLSEFWYFIPIGISSSFFPHLIALKKEISVQYKKRFAILHSIVFWMALLGACVTQFAADFVILKIYGYDYFNSSLILKIHIWASLFVFLGVAGSNYYILENLQKFTIFKSFFGLLVNIILNYFWIPEYGIVGAAYATLISQFCANTLFLVFFRSLHPLLFLQFGSLLEIRFLNIKSIFRNQVSVYHSND